MQKLLILIFFCLSFLLACNTTSEQLTIPEDKLIPLLADIHFAEAAVNNVFGEQKDSLLQIYYSQIYVFHDIGKEEFEKNMSILRKNPSRLESLYKIVTDSIAQKESK